MATTHYNISGELTTELLAVGDNFNVTQISLANVHDDTTCKADLYIEKTTGLFYFMKNVAIPAGVTLIIEKGDLKFNNKADEFGLYIKLTKTASETPTVDVIIS